MTTSYNRDIATSDTAAELTDGYHLVVEALKLNDIRTIYGVVGIPITDVARIAQASGMRYIGFRHESDAGHTAAAAGFMTKKPGICLTVPAPGFLNGLVALANATTNCFPMVQISGSSERHIVDLKRGDYEELDQLAVAEAFAKAAYRVGNRSRGHVQGVYPTAADDAWVALCVCDDADWAHIVEAMGRPDLLRDSGFASAEQWRLAHDEFDTVVARLDSNSDRGGYRQRPWRTACSGRTGADARPDVRHTPLDAREYYEEVEHPVTGPHRYPGWPFRMTPGPSRHHRSAPPTLGQHNEEVLRSLGYPVTNSKNCAPDMSSVRPRSTHSRLHRRPVGPFALSQLIRRDRIEGGGIASEPGRGVGKRMRALEPEATRRKGAEEQGAAQLRPVL
jgi:hypothetical protein